MKLINQINARKVLATYKDERMSTAQAHKRLRSAGKNHRKARKIVDAQAAVGILDSVLHALDQGRAIHYELDVKETHE